MDQSKLEEYVEEIKNYFRICKGSFAHPPGFVLLTNRKLPIKHLVALLALGKICSHSLNLSETLIVTPKECYDTLRKQVKAKQSTVFYYATKLADEGYLKRVKRGKYVFNVDKLDAFLEELKLVSASC
ncbi:hypothetical protein [Archaeoglobus sp.]